MTYRDYAWLLPGAALALAAGILIGRAAAAWVLFIPLVLCAALACWLLKWPQRFAGSLQLNEGQFAAGQENQTVWHPI